MYSQQQINHGMGVRFLCFCLYNTNEILTLQGINQYLFNLSFLFLIICKKNNSCSMIIKIMEQKLFVNMKK